MAIPTDDSTEKTSVSAEVTIDENTETPVQPVSDDDQKVPDEGTASEDIAIVSGDTVSSDDTEQVHVRKEEVMELLGGTEAPENEEPEIVPVQDTVGEDDVTDSFNSLPDNPVIPEAAVEPENAAAEHPDYGVELKIIQESLHDSLTNTQSISSKIDVLSSNTDGLLKQLNGLSLNYELLSAEMETISSDSHSKSVLSKTFLIISSVIIALLVVFQLYMFTSLIKTERLQNVAGSAVMENITSLNKKMAEYDKNLTKALEHPPQQEHVQPNPAVAENGGHEIAAHKEAGPVSVTPVLEKLNRLRNGLSEKKLIRKETGDWFVYGKKSEECISDVEVIETLNQAYRKIGRSTSPGIPMPAHNALCILKPDGKGGTQVVMTKDFLP
ncbi:MAG: hypothetical protein HGB32_06165 [Geobacteraceae bacterium]|nr:hypothetical protein [Geobacteraceae bacterium]NTW79717.1 hypothetical protein [Geobacteraceae bacterium]